MVGTQAFVLLLFFKSFVCDSFHNLKKHRREKHHLQKNVNIYYAFRKHKYYKFVYFTKL